ncbi:NAD(P)/FAD-dependent oxidoreductase [Pseudomonas sp. PGPPP1]|uniref:NAD(P)/FAD-dependent oxidoreductase n=1 Tax=Pseudomonas sp. PGPPP1 TaxID=2015553 RepID=UPI00257A670C|nr:NAD(P)/FAD-dependent oxidoreductase [Pseudomonas sp. PGPPP1]
MERYDVIVIGAGPAGCACAIHSARNGMSVAIIERHPATRDRPGETLHPGIEPLLHQLGVAEWVNNGGFARPLGVWVAWQHERRFVPFGEDANGPWRGFQIPGARLDSLLLEAAKACNVVIRQPCHAKGVITRHQRVIGVQTNEGVLHSTYLVDASGANGWLARQLGLKLHRYSAPLMAFYGYVQIEDDDERPPEGMFADPFGWYWWLIWVTAAITGRGCDLSMPLTNGRTLLPCRSQASTPWGKHAALMSPGGSTTIWRATATSSRGMRRRFSTLRHPMACSRQSCPEQWLPMGFYRAGHPGHSNMQSQCITINGYRTGSIRM